MAKIANISVGMNHPVRIMGILNASPESFYKKSIHSSSRAIREYAKKIQDDGADFIDVGGMSSAPYLSTMVSEKLEKTRVLCAIKSIKDATNLPISVDTCRASVAKSALQEGADIVNDITGLKYDPLMPKVIHDFSPSLVLCAYDSGTVSGNHVVMVKKLLQKSLAIAKKSNISTNKIILDPAIGFFRKTGKGPLFTKIKSDWVLRDLDMIRNLYRISRTLPIMVSVSNKSFLAGISGKKNPSDRLHASIAAEAISVMYGASMIRTHNVLETISAVKVASKIKRYKGL